MVSLPKLVSSLDFSKGERVFFEGDGEARGLTGVDGEGLPGVDGERSEFRARLEAAFTGVRKPSLSYCTWGIDENETYSFQRAKIKKSSQQDHRTAAKVKEEKHLRRVIQVKASASL